MAETSTETPIPNAPPKAAAQRTPKETADVVKSLQGLNVPELMKAPEVRRIMQELAPEINSFGAVYGQDIEHLDSRQIKAAQNEIAAANGKLLEGVARALKDSFDITVPNPGGEMSDKGKLALKIQMAIQVCAETSCTMSDVKALPKGAAQASAKDPVAKPVLPR